MRDLIQGEADVDDEENDESFDEETGEPRRKARDTNGADEDGEMDDSSEEEEDDDDEEEARKVSCSRSWLLRPRHQLTVPSGS